MTTLTTYYLLLTTYYVLHATYSLQVEIELTHAGLHYVLIRGPSSGTASTILAPAPWNVTVNGVCPEFMSRLEDDTCACSPGEESAPDGLTCNTCPEGFVKPTLEGRCSHCADETLDEYRRMTRILSTNSTGEIVSSSPANLHDEASDCGCQENFVV